MTVAGSAPGLSQTNSVQESCCGQQALGVLVPTCLGDPGKAHLSRPVSPYVEGGGGGGGNARGPFQLQDAPFCNEVGCGKR